MSAAVCGKRSFFEDLAIPSPVSKRIRCSSTSPIRFSPPRTHTVALAASSSFLNLIDQLIAIFPNMDNKLIERALQECGNDLDLTIKRLNELCLGYAGKTSFPAVSKSDIIHEAGAYSSAETVEKVSVLPNRLQSAGEIPVHGMEWVELFVMEIMGSSNIDDARARVSRLLESLEKTLCKHVGEEASSHLQQENMHLKEQLQGLMKENMILKRAVAIQHERQKEHEDKNRELKDLKQMVCRFQEQLRALELNNYALALHLKQAQHSSSIPGHFHPDVF